MEIEIDTYISSRGGFMKPIILKISDEIANDLRGDKTDELGLYPNGVYRGNRYWSAVRHIKFIIANWVGIGWWDESRQERTLMGDPISIICFRKLPPT